MIKFILVNFQNEYIQKGVTMGIGDWGLGICGLGIGPNPQSPIPRKN